MRRSMTEAIRAIEAHSPIRIEVEPELRARLGQLAAGRPIVIDHFASYRCGATIGDLRVRFGADLSPTPVAELDSVDDVRVVAEIDILPILAGGAEVRLAGPSFAPHLALSLTRPEAWLDFLHTHPHRRR